MPDANSGCSCEAVGSKSSSDGWALLLMAAGALLLSRRRLRAGAWLAAAIASVVMPSRVWAGPIEVLSAIEVAKSDPKRIVARWTFGDGGMYVSSDGGTSFQATCFGALGGANLQDTDVMSFKTAQDGSICVGTQDGVHCSNDKACGWKEASEVRGQWVADFATDPVDPNRLYFVTGTSEGKNGIFVRESPTSTWKPFGTHVNAWFTRIHVVRHGDGKRFYVSALENIDVQGEDGGVSTETHYSIRYSDDDGVTWTSHRYDAVPQRASLRLVAVDPSDVQRIVIATLRPADNLTDELLYSDRAGEPGSFKMIGEVIELGGVAFAPDGTFYYGDNFGMMPGLFKVPKLGEPTVELDGALKVSCLGFDPAGERLYACSDWLLGTLDPSTGAIDTMFDLREATELLRCEGETTTAHACAAAFLPPNFCDPSHYPEAPICSRYFGGASGAGAAGAAGQGTPQAGRGAAGAGGAAGAAGDATAGDEGSDDGGCGCAAVGSGRGPGLGAVVAVSLVLGLVYRRARRRH